MRARFAADPAAVVSGIPAQADPAGMEFHRNDLDSDAVLPPAKRRMLWGGSDDSHQQQTAKAAAVRAGHPTDRQEATWTT
jgi:hypothetical protein